MGMKNILLIDDEEPFCELVRMNLETSDKYRVLTAYNGKAGIEIAKDIKPDVILLDIMMPKMDGFEVLKILKKHTETMAIPIIMLTSVNEDAAKIKASEMYSSHYLTKPVTTNDLVAKIEWVLGLRGK